MSKRYSFKDHGQSSQGMFDNNKVLLPNKAPVRTLAWQQFVSTTVRLFAPPSSDGTDNAYRLSAEPSDFGDWIRRYTGVKSFGDKSQVTFITGNPCGNVEDSMQVPSNVLYAAIRNACKARQAQPSFPALLEGAANRGAALTHTVDLYLMQGFIVGKSGQTLSGDKIDNFTQGPVPVIQLSSSAGRALLAELNKERAGITDAQKADWRIRYEAGDPIDPQYGSFITFYRLEDGDPRVQQAPAAAGWTAFSGAQGAAATPKGYGCFLAQSLGNPPTSADFSSMWPGIAPRLQRWDDIIWFPSVNDQAEIIADLFDPEVILYGWRDFPEWIPERVRRRASAVAFVNAPANGWQGGWAAQSGPSFGSGFGNPVTAPGMPSGVGPGGVAGYSQPQPGYGQPQPGYGHQQPQPGYGAPQGAYESQPVSQPQPPVGFGQQQPPVGFGQPQPPVSGFGQPPIGFGQPQPGPANAPTGFGQPQGAFGVPPVSSGYTPPQSAAAPGAPAGVGAPGGFGASAMPGQPTGFFGVAGGQSGNSPQVANGNTLPFTPTPLPTAALTTPPVAVTHMPMGGPAGGPAATPAAGPAGVAAAAAPHWGAPATPPATTATAGGINGPANGTRAHSILAMAQQAAPQQS